MDYDFEPLIDANEVAILLGGLHPKTVLQMARQGKIPGVRIGKFWRFRKSSINQWVQSQMNCTPMRLAQKGENPNNYAAVLNTNEHKFGM